MKGSTFFGRWKETSAADFDGRRRRGVSTGSVSCSRIPRAALCSIEGVSRYINNELTGRRIQVLTALKQVPNMWSEKHFQGNPARRSRSAKQDRVVVLPRRSSAVAVLDSARVNSDE